VIVLDTNVLSELMRDTPAVRVLQWIDAQETSSLAITSITAAELLYGLARLPDGARKADLASAIQPLVHEDFSGRVLPFDVRAAEQYADLVATREHQGRPVSMADGQIAAICRVHDAELATRNLRDFDATGISVLDPWTTG
jgi:toxin FitB